MSLWGACRPLAAPSLGALTEPSSSLWLGGSGPWVTESFNHKGVREEQHNGNISAHAAFRTCSGSYTEQCMGPEPQCDTVSSRTRLEDENM